jgi:hypothetical protein
LCQGPAALKGQLPCQRVVSLPNALQPKRQTVSVWQQRARMHKHAQGTQSLSLLFLSVGPFLYNRIIQSKVHPQPTNSLFLPTRVALCPDSGIFSCRLGGFDQTSVSRLSRAVSVEDPSLPLVMPPCMISCLPPTVTRYETQT